MHKWKWLFCLVPLVCCSTFAIAGPTEDYEAGAKAFKAGDTQDAMPLLKKAADKGHAVAQALLAHILDIAEFDEDAADYYRLSANQGNAEGQFGLASMYLKGEGVPKNIEEARKLALLAANQGQHDAIAMLAQAYITGGLGFDAAAMQSPEALTWIKRASDINYLPAVIALSVAYGKGQYGLAVDPKMVEILDAKAHQIRKKTESGNASPKVDAANKPSKK